MSHGTSFNMSLDTSSIMYSVNNIEELLKTFFPRDGINFFDLTTTKFDKLLDLFNAMIKSILIKTEYKMTIRTEHKTVDAFENCVSAPLIGDGIYGHKIELNNNCGRILLGNVVQIYQKDNYVLVVSMIKTKTDTSDITKIACVKYSDLYNECFIDFTA